MSGMPSFLGPACMVANLAVAMCGVVTNLRANGLPLMVFVELPWVGERKAPFLLASTIFGTQAFVTLLLVCIMKHMRDLAECWGPGFQRMLKMYACMSSIGTVMYFMKYWSSFHIAVGMQGVGHYFLTRHIHWLFSTPVQWYVFSQVCCKKASFKDMRMIYLGTVLTHVFGILMFFMQGQMRWFCFWTSACYFIDSFWRAFQLPLLKDMQVMGGHLRIAMCLVWTGFPVVMLGRWCGIIGPWEEQVLSFSLLDVVAKSATFAAIITSRVILALARINSTVQLVISSQDLTFTVDGAWRLSEDCASTGVLAACFGENVDDLKIIDQCINEEHRNRLIEAARTADSQSLGSPTPKVTVAFRLPGGSGEMLAECLVSKCLQGRRIIGMAVASQASNIHCLQSEHVPSDRIDQTPSEISMSSMQSRSVDMQMKLALHNISDVLQLSEQMTRMLGHLFMQGHTACAMFAWEQAAAAPAVIAASPRLQATFFHGMPMPQPLSSVASEAMVDRMLLALQVEDLILHQWRGVQLPAGCIAELNMVPLNWICPLPCGLNLCVLVIVMTESAEKSSQSGYFCWRCSGDQLVCINMISSEASELSPPLLLQPLLQSYLERLTQDR